jgi:hypothetical protein
MSRLSARICDGLSLLLIVLFAGASPHRLGVTSPAVDGWLALMVVSRMLRLWGIPKVSPKGGKGPSL